MRVINFFIIAMVSMVGISLAGCSGAPIKTGDANQYAGASQIDTYRGRKISATASGFQLLLFIPINVNSRHERAWNALLSQAAGDYVTNIKINESWTYGFVGTVYRTTLEATAYPRTGGSSTSTPGGAAKPGYFIGGQD